MFDEHGQVAIFKTHGLSAEQAARIAHPPKGIGLLGYIQHHRKPLRLAKMQAHPQAAGFPDGHPPMESLLACPIVHGEVSITLSNMASLTQKLHSDMQLLLGLTERFRI